MYISLQDTTYFFIEMQKYSRKVFIFGGNQFPQITLWGRTQDLPGLPCFSGSLLDLDCKYPTSWGISLMEKSLQSGEPVISKKATSWGSQKESLT